MKCPTLFALAVLVFAACGDTVQPEIAVPDRSPRFTVVTVPGDFPSVQAAHDAASSGDTIIVEPGTHTGQITVTKAITLASRFLTTGDSHFIATTILDGDSADFVIDIPDGAGPCCIGDVSLQSTRAYHSRGKSTLCAIHVATRSPSHLAGRICMYFTIASSSRSSSGQQELRERNARRGNPNSSM